MLAHYVKFGENGADFIRIIEHHIISWPDNLKSRVKYEEGLQQVLLVPIKLIFIVHRRIGAWQAYVMDVNKYPRR
jgi:hypothetical protein